MVEREECPDHRWAGAEPVGCTAGGACPTLRNWHASP
jgi:hypothetical protein